MAELKPTEFEQAAIDAHDKPWWRMYINSRRAIRDRLTNDLIRMDGSNINAENVLRGRIQELNAEINLDETVGLKIKEKALKAEKERRDGS